MFPDPPNGAVDFVFGMESTSGEAPRANVGRVPIRDERDTLQPRGFTMMLPLISSTARSSGERSSPALARAASFRSRPEMFLGLRALTD